MIHLKIKTFIEPSAFYFKLNKIKILVHQNLGNCENEQQKSKLWRLCYNYDKQFTKNVSNRELHHTAVINL